MSGEGPAGQGSSATEHPAIDGVEEIPGGIEEQHIGDSNSENTEKIYLSANIGHLWQPPHLGSSGFLSPLTPRFCTRPLR